MSLILLMINLGNSDPAGAHHLGDGLLDPVAGASDFRSRGLVSSTGKIYLQSVELNCKWQ